MNQHFTLGRKTIILSSIMIVLFLLSSMTAVAQTQGSIAVKKLEETHQTRNLLGTLSSTQKAQTKEKFNISSLTQNKLQKNAKKTLFALLENIKNKIPTLNLENKKLTNDERSKVSHMILIFAEYLQQIAQQPTLRSDPAIFDTVNKKIQQAAKSTNNDDKEILTRAQSLIKTTQKLTNKLLTTTQQSKDLSEILPTLHSDITKLQTILHKTTQSKPDEQLLGRNLKTIFTHYQSENIPTPSSVANTNLTTILIIIAIILLVGGFIIFSPIIMPAIGAVITVLSIVATPFLLALIPLLAALIQIMIGGALIGLVLSAFGILLLLLALLGVAALATAVVLAVIVILVILLILLSILLPTIGLLIAGLGLLIGGIIAALPILGPIMIPIITIAIIALIGINFATGGSIFEWIYDKLPASLAQTITSLCETLYGIPVLGQLLATLLPGLPWPGNTTKQRENPFSHLLLTAILKRFKRHNQPSKHPSFS